MKIAASLLLPDLRDWTDRRMTRRSLHQAGFLAAAFLLTQCTGVTGMARDGSPPVIDPAVRSAVSGGPSRVIVELRIAPTFKPEGDLPDPAAVANQRQAIARAQSELLGRLAGTKFSVSRLYDGLPMMALEIGGEALSRLEASGDLVARVLADARRAPQS
jgi:hypothetical protein